MSMVVGGSYLPEFRRSHDLLLLIGGSVMVVVYPCKPSCSAIKAQLSTSRPHSSSDAVTQDDRGSVRR